MSLNKLLRKPSNILIYSVNPDIYRLVDSLLIANKKNKITLFTPYNFRLTTKDERITIVIGPSDKTIYNYSMNYNIFDVFYIDDTNFRDANLAFFNCYKMAHSSSYIVLSNMDRPHIQALWNSFIKDKKIIPTELDNTKAIGIYNKYDLLLLEEIVGRTCRYVFPRTERSEQNWNNDKLCDRIIINDEEDLKLVEPYSIIYGDLSEYQKFTLFMKLKVPFILVSGDDDCTVNNTLKLLNNPYLIRWFTTNKDSKHPKMEYLPVGISKNIPTLQGQSPRDTTQSMIYENCFNSKPIKDLLEQTNPKKNFLNPKMNLLYARLSSSSSHSNPTLENIREIWIGRLKSKKLFTETNLVPWEQYIEELKSYKFALCPAGQGFDTYRVWEALTMGVIPIVNSSPLNQMYEGLPVMILNNVDNLTPESLLQVYPKFIANVDKYNWDKLTSSYWANRIKNVWIDK